MATYALQGPSHAGATISLQTPGGTIGDLAPTGQGIALFVQAGTTAVTVVLPVAPLYDNLPVANRAFTVPANQVALIPLPSSVYGVGTTQIQYSQISTPQVGVVTIP